jgi:uncharacterized protein (TIGR02145 family)
MKNLALIIAAIFFSANMFAQTEMKIRKTDNSIVSIPILDIDSVYYEEGNAVFTCGDQITDYDGNTYNTLLIGSQCWLSENLKVTHYADGTFIPNVEDNTMWDNLGYTSEAMCWYDNDISNKAIYGGLYTYATATNACPDGWHLPSKAEYETLILVVGTNSGSKLAGNSTLWPSGDLINDVNFGLSGFNALPAGVRVSDGTFINVGLGSVWWCSTLFGSGTQQAYDIGIYLNSTDTYIQDSRMDYGQSVRCVKD